MNATLCCDTKTDLKIYDLAVMTDDSYDTMPLGIVLPRALPVDEDVLYTSFEAALSDRLIALNDHKNCQSDCELTSIQQQTPAYATDLFQTPPDAADLFQTPSYATNLLLVEQPHASTEPLIIQTEQSNKISGLWTRRVTFVCLALMLLMIGFDLMGLLVLLIR